MIEFIPDLVAAGIDSFKIEGRMRSMHYVASVVNAYLARPSIRRPGRSGDTRPATNCAGSGPARCLKAANRPLNTGFYYGNRRRATIFTDLKTNRCGRFYRLVLEYDEAAGEAVIEQRNHFKPGQRIEFFSPEGVRFEMTVPELKDESGEPVDAARHPLQKIRMRVDAPVKPMDIMRKWLQ